VITIHDLPGSFSDRWIEQCVRRSIPFIRVDMFSNDLWSILRTNDVKVLLAHPPMADVAVNLAAKSIIQVLTRAGVTVFPNASDYWHYDDKIAQKYIFETLDVRCPKTDVFYDRANALAWLETAGMPFVTKLSAGAGSINVSIVRNKREATRRINRMFGPGEHVASGAMKDWATKFRIHKTNRDFLPTIRRLPGTLGVWWRNRRNLPRERGYVYFQEFIPGNSFDTRITVIGARAFGFRRHVRPGDFRASGSGSIDHDPRGIDLRCVGAAFDVARILESHCMSFDFIFEDGKAEPLLLEMSYAFAAKPVADCPGFWAVDLQWQAKPMWPQDAILEDILNSAS